MFRICVVGCGEMATGGHGPSYVKYAASHPGTVLAGCCDIHAERAETFREKFGFQKAYTDYEQMLDEIHPDVVCLISPVHATCELAVSIFKKGYAVLMEKPPGRNRQEIERMMQAAQEAGVSARSAFNRRYTPLTVRLKELMGGERIRSITYQMYRRDRTDADFSTTAIHAIDAVKHIAGSDYRSVDFVYQELPECGPCVANIFMTGSMENGAVSQLTLVPMGGTVVERVTVNTDQASYFVELPFWNNPDSPGRLRRMCGADITHDISGDALVDQCVMFEESGFFEENRGFFEHLRSGEEADCDLEKAIQSVEIADCIRKRESRYLKKERLDE